MPRRRRIIVPGEIHHVMSRGLNGMTLFKDAHDRKQFLTILSNRLPEAECYCYAWVLMDNHYHLLLRPLGQDLKGIMRRINSAYANYYNRRYQRRGYVFQDRYKSLATQEYFYVRELIRYIHLNPLRAGIVKTIKALDKYSWSGHQALIGKQEVHWQAVEEALFRFGAHISDARKKYIQYLKDGLGQKQFGWKSKEVPDETMNISTDERIMGDSEFVRRAIIQSECDMRFKHEMMKSRPTLEALLKHESLVARIGQNEALVRGRLDARTKVRTAFCSQAVKKYGYTGREVSVFLGINPGSVSRMILKDNKKQQKQPRPYFSLPLKRL